MELELEIETRDPTIAKPLAVGVPMKLSDGAELVYKGPVFMKAHLDIGQIFRFVVHAAEDIAEDISVALFAQALYDKLRGTFGQITRVTVNTTVITMITKDSLQQTIIQVVKESQTKQ